MTIEQKLQAVIEAQREGGLAKPPLMKELDGLITATIP